MYSRTYEFVQPNSYSYAPQNFPGALHYAYGYSQTRCTSYNSHLQPQPRLPRAQFPPPRLSHPSDQQGGHHRSQTEDRPSCMLQEVWRPSLSCSTSNREQYEESNDESVEDSVTDSPSPEEKNEIVCWQQEEKRKNSFHKTSTRRAWERIPSQQLPDKITAVRDCGESGLDRETD